MERIKEVIPFLNENDLIMKLYASLTHPDGFKHFLEPLGENLNAASVFLVGMKRRPAQVEFFWGTGVPDNFFHEYMVERSNIEKDAVLSLACQQGPGDFQTGIHALRTMQNQGGADRWEEGYRNYRAMGFADSAWSVVHSTDDSVLVMSLVRHQEQGEYSDAELAPLNRLVPHLRQAFQIYKDIHRIELKGSTLEAVLNAMDQPVFILGRFAELLFQNSEASSYMARTDHFQIANGRISFNEGVANNQFNAALAEAFELHQKGESYGTSNFFLHQRGLLSSVFTFSVIEEVSLGRVVLLKILEPKNRSLPSAQEISRYFSISMPQAEICELLVQGLGVNEIAQRLHKSENTIRSYLKQSYAATGFNRQSQLVSAILVALMS